MNLGLDPLKRRFLIAALAGSVVLSWLVGCTPSTKTGSASIVKDEAAMPALRRSYSVAIPDNASFGNDYPLSPDGRQVAIYVNDPQKGQEIWVFPATGGSGRLVAQVGPKETAAGTLLLTVVGWGKDGSLVYARQGTQPDGAHKGSRGVSLTYTFDSNGTDFAWIPTDRNQYVSGIYSGLNQGAVFVQAGTTLWRAPTTGLAPQAINRRLAAGVGSSLAISPDSMQFCYQTWSAGREGVWLIDGRTGAEKRIFQQGDATGFYPKWSPDGKMVAFYTAFKAVGAKSPYDLISGEDGPMAVGNAIDIMSIAGQRVARLEVKGKRIGQFVWLAGGKYIGFMVGVDKSPGVEWQAIHYADLTGKITKISDFKHGAAGVTLMDLSADAKELYYLVNTQKSSQVFYVDASGVPKAVEAAAGQPLAWDDWQTRVIAKSLLTLGASTDKAPDRKSLYQIFKGQARSIATGGMRTLPGNVVGARFVCILEDTASKQLSLGTYDSR